VSKVEVLRPECECGRAVAVRQEEERLVRVVATIQKLHYRDKHSGEEARGDG
jgi:hypothetical protein